MGRVDEPPVSPDGAHAQLLTRYTFIDCSASATSTGVGEKTSLAIGTWAGWMAHLPSKPAGWPAPPSVGTPPSPDRRGTARRPRRPCPPAPRSAPVPGRSARSRPGTRRRGRSCRPHGRGGRRRGRRRRRSAPRAGRSPARSERVGQPLGFFDQHLEADGLRVRPSLTLELGQQDVDPPDVPGCRTLGTISTSTPPCPGDYLNDVAVAPGRLEAVHPDGPDGPAQSSSRSAPTAVRRAGSLTTGAQASSRSGRPGRRPRSAPSRTCARYWPVWPTRNVGLSVRARSILPRLQMVPSARNAARRPPRGRGGPRRRRRCTSPRFRPRWSTPPGVSLNRATGACTVIVPKSASATSPDGRQAGARRPTAAPRRRRVRRQPRPARDRVHRLGQGALADPARGRGRPPFRVPGPAGAPGRRTRGRRPARAGRSLRTHAVDVRRRTRDDEPATVGGLESISGALAGSMLPPRALRSSPGGCSPASTSRSASASGSIRFTSTSYPRRRQRHGH